MITIPIIDVFAGPGGLGEGFSAFEDVDLKFKIALSIEKDKAAHQTLELRAFVRQFHKNEIPEAYYDYIGGVISKQELFNRFPSQYKNAAKEAWLHELKDGDIRVVTSRAKKALASFECKHSILIGGPPCQAYSIAGRSRMFYQENFKNDERNFLYKHYLRLVAHLTPTIFVMENVKGILTASVKGEPIFRKILKDLEYPGKAVQELDGLSNEITDKEYDIYSLVSEQETTEDDHGVHVKPLKPQDYIIKSENFGIPQRRHRVILLGVRKDLDPRIRSLLTESKQVNVGDVINDLPKIRSGITKVENNWESWISAFAQANATNQFVDVPHTVSNEIISVMQTMEDKKLALGKSVLKRDKRKKTKQLSNWYSDDSLNVVCNHEAKSHMQSDLWRYLFASSFARTLGRSPVLADYPDNLLPAHNNIDPKNKKSARFVDRFKVQIESSPASTVTSHISKDGHFFIHHDPSQCRSWSVREAARIQTFPDNYFFEGNKTQQYHQVGNAVPPLLAHKISKVVGEYLKVIVSRQI